MLDEIVKRECSLMKKCEEVGEVEKIKSGFFALMVDGSPRNSKELASWRGFRGKNLRHPTESSSSYWQHQLGCIVREAEGLLQIDNGRYFGSCGHGAESIGVVQIIVLWGTLRGE